MTEALYLKDHYLKEFEAKVQTIKENKFIILDKTAFYPAGGGQEHDTGKIIRKNDGMTFNIVFCGKSESTISHEIVQDEDNPLKEGDEVHGIIDWNRRYALSRYHTAAHVISAHFTKKLPVKVTGNQKYPDKGRIDFNLEEMDKELIKNITLECNNILAEDHKVSFYNMRRKEVEKDPDLCKLAKGLPEGIEILRIVESEGIDKQADAGTHVNSTKECGTIEVIKVENRGKNNRRLYFRLV
jgi:misacylated tRNA(Ala) deacylase